ATRTTTPRRRRAPTAAPGARAPSPTTGRTATSRPSSSTRPPGTSTCSSPRRSSIAAIPRPSCPGSRRPTATACRVWSTATATATPGQVVTGQAVTFSGSATDPDGEALGTPQWSFDDGTTASGFSVAHAFATPGTHTGTLSVPDAAGVVGQGQAAVTVNAPP